MVDRKALSELRQEIVWLREDRKRLEDSLFRLRKMIRASLVFLPNYCGKKDCRQAGEIIVANQGIKKSPKSWRKY